MHLVKSTLKSPVMKYKKMKIGFVVLHYKAYDMTIKCIDALLNLLTTKDYLIVIVDNGSADGSGEKLSDKYKDYSCVKVILNTKNLGFARGNNVGYRYLKKCYNPRFIIVMNNDVVITQKDFIDKMESIYEKNRFDVLGPDIINPFLEIHQNPSRLRPLTHDEVKSRYKSFLRRVKLPHLYYYLSVVRRHLKPNSRSTNNMNYQIAREGVVLHGACYIFSTNYIKHRVDCFNPCTFLYHEEDILFYECMKSGLKVLYSPEIFVEHYEDVSTDAAFKSEFEKMKTRNVWLKDSAKTLMDVMHQD